MGVSKAVAQIAAVALEGGSRRLVAAICPHRFERLVGQHAAANARLVLRFQIFEARHLLIQGAGGDDAHQMGILMAAWVVSAR